jgi:hypothetical protein
VNTPEVRQAVTMLAVTMAMGDRASMGRVSTVEVTRPTVSILPASIQNMEMEVRANTAEGIQRDRTGIFNIYICTRMRFTQPQSGTGCLMSLSCVRIEETNYISSGCFVTSR